MIKPTKLFSLRQSIELGHPQHPLVKRYTWFLSSTKKKKRKSTSVGEKNKPQNAKAHFLWILMIWRMVQLYEVDIREQKGRLVKPPTNLTKIVIVTSSLFPLCSALLFLQGVPFINHFCQVSERFHQTTSLLSDIYFVKLYGSSDHQDPKEMINSTISVSFTFVIL